MAEPTDTELLDWLQEYIMESPRGPVAITVYDRKVSACYPEYQYARKDLRSAIKAAQNRFGTKRPQPPTTSITEPTETQVSSRLKVFGDEVFWSQLPHLHVATVRATQPSRLPCFGVRFYAIAVGHLSSPATWPRNRSRQAASVSPELSTAM